MTEDRQTDRQTVRQTDKQTDRQKNGKLEKEQTNTDRKSKMSP